MTSINPSRHRMNHNLRMLIDDVEQIIRRIPGLTATQISQELFGLNGYGERVRGACNALFKAGRVHRSGGGKVGDPFIYYPLPESFGFGSLMLNERRELEAPIL